MGTRKWDFEAGKWNWYLLSPSEPLLKVLDVWRKFSFIAKSDWPSGILAEIQSSRLDFPWNNLWFEWSHTNHLTDSRAIYAVTVSTSTTFARLSNLYINLTCKSRFAIRFMRRLCYWTADKEGLCWSVPIYLI